MSYTIIPELPPGGRENGFAVDVNQDLLVLEQDITRKITPLSFLTNSIPQLIPYNVPTIKWDANNLAFTVSDLVAVSAQNVTLKNLMDYVNHHLNVIDEVFFVATDGVDSIDYDERGRNEQLPFKTIKFAAQQISKKIANDANYGINPTDPTLVIDNPVQDHTRPSPLFNSNPYIAAGSSSPLQNTSKIRKQYTIMVRSGNYIEDNPVYLPPGTSMIGDNLRRTTIRPKNPQLDLFWLDSANYVWGFSFRDHKAPSCAVAFPIPKPVYDIANGSPALPVLEQYWTENVPVEYLDYNGNLYTGDDAKIRWVIDSYEKAYKTTLIDETSLQPTGEAIDASVAPTRRTKILLSPYVQGCTSYAISDRMPDDVVGSNRNNPLYPKSWYLDDGNAIDPVTGKLKPTGGTPCGPVEIINSDGTVTVQTTGVPPPNNAGGGMRIDGSLVDGYFRSMVLDSFTQVNQGGLGIFILNHGYAQLVSIFSIATYQGVRCEAGGSCSISTSNSTFGLSGLVGLGMSYTPVLTGRFVIPSTASYPISCAPTADNNTVGVYGYTNGNNLFTINDVQAVAVKYPNDEITDISNPFFTVASQPYATLCFVVGDDKPWITNLYDVENHGAAPIYSGPGYLLEDQINELIERKYAMYYKEIEPGSDNITNTSTPWSVLSGNPMHEVKLFYIEQGAPTQSLSGGKSDINSSTYDIYDKYHLSYPSQELTDNLEFNQGLPWDISLSYNLPFNLTQTMPSSAYDDYGNPLQWNINYKSNLFPVDYKIYVDKSTGRYVPQNQIDPTNTNQTLTACSTFKGLANQTYFNSLCGASGVVIDFTDAPVRFYARSVLETGSHTFEYMGTGTRMKYAIPAFGGVANNINECIADGFNDVDEYGNNLGNKPGTVFFTSSNELGNFKVGTDFTIVQSTGTIQGDTFSRAILTLVTPLTIVLE